MFIDSITDGIQILSYWRFWVVALGAGIIVFIPYFLISLVTARSEGASAAAGCLMAPSMFIWPPLVTTVTVLLLAPLMIWRKNEILFDFVALFTWWEIAKITFLGFVVSMLVAIIPFVGSFNSVPIFAQCLSILGIVMFLASDGQANIWPGFLMTLGFALVGGFVSIVVLNALAALLVVLIKKFDEDVAILVSQPIALVPALIPACFYAGWLRQVNGF